MRRRLVEFDYHDRRAVLQLVDHLHGTGLAECPVAPRQVVESGLLRDDGVGVLIGSDELEVTERRVRKILPDGREDFSLGLMYLLNSGNDARRFDSESGSKD